MIFERTNRISFKSEINFSLGDFRNLDFKHNKSQYCVSSASFAAILIYE